MYFKASNIFYMKFVLSTIACNLFLLKCEQKISRPTTFVSMDCPYIVELAMCLPICD